MRDALNAAILYLQTHFFARWLLANILGWSLGLYCGSLGLRLFGGVIGLIIGGGLTGGIVGGAQWLALRDSAEWAEKRWIWRSAMGGALGVFPAFLAGVTLLVGSGIGLFVMGGLFGGIFGAVQMTLLNEHFDHSRWWIVANGLAGALCGLLSLAANPLYLPVCCSLGPAAFGLVTGYALLRLMRSASK